VIAGGDDVVRGGIDLSSGAVMGLTGGITAMLISIGTSIPLAVIAGLGAAVLIGVLNSSAVLLGIRPLLVTLAVGGIATSADLVFTNNTQVRVTDGFFIWLRDGNVLGLPVPVAVLIVTFAAMWFMMNKTSVGVRAYAVGGHDVAARVAGINPGRYIFSSYLLSAFTAGLAGLLIVARLSGSTPGVGALMLMDVLLAAFMSVIFSRRLVPNLWGALASAIFIAVLNNGFTLINVPNYWVSGVKGVLILVVVSISALRSRRS
jgi:ribose transport system permease protein